MGASKNGQLLVKEDTKEGRACSPTACQNARCLVRPKLLGARLKTLAPGLGHVYYRALAARPRDDFEEKLEAGGSLGTLEHRHLAFAARGARRPLRLLEPSRLHRPLA